MGNDINKDSTESPGDPFSIVYYICFLSGKTNLKMPLFLLHAPHGNFPSLFYGKCHSTFTVMWDRKESALIEEKRGSVKETTTHETNKHYCNQFSYCHVWNFQPLRPQN